MGGFGNSIDKYDIFELLGRGGFGQVYRAKVRESGMEVAIKMIDKKQVKDARMANRVKQEVSIHSQLKHPSVVELYTFFEDERNVYLVLELCHNGTLQSYLQNQLTTFWEPQARIILRQVVDGLLYLHKHNIIHRDITLANLLLTRDRSVKIGDFGLATQLSSPDEKHMTMCGTPNYISPEIAVRGSHGLETDVWGLGIILYTLLVGKPPFDTENREMILQQVAMREVEFPEHLTTDSIDLIKLLLKKNPKDRIRLTQILQHPFMTHSFFSSNPSSQCGSRDSGVATSKSVSSTLQTRSYNDQVLDGSVARTPAPPLYPVLPSSMSHNSHHSVQKSSGFHHGYSSVSASSRHTGLVPFKSAMSDRHYVEMPRSDVLHGSSSFPHSADIPAFEPPSHRFYSASNPPSITYKDTNCSHAWKQCGCGHGNVQCCHVETCSCMRSNGCNSSCARSTSNYNSCINTNQQQEPAYMPSHPSLESKPPSVTNSKLVPLNTTRLKPIRQKTKQVILSILENGEVCLEFIKQKNKSEKVFEVLRISEDGQWIVVYYPNKGKGVSPGDIPPPLPSEPERFWLGNLPEKFIKKYSYASRFVDLVKAQTPKVIYYTDEAKCMLMENGPDADFQVHFYDGAKLNKSGSQVKITDENGYTSTHYVGCDETELPPAVKNMWKHFKYWLEKCKSLEKGLDELSSSTGCVGVFPNRSGERPKRNANTPATKKPSSEVGRSGTNGYAGSVVSSKSGSLKQGRILKQVHIPNIGLAMQMSNGVVCVQYSDSSKLFIDPSSSKISHQDSHGISSHYQQQDKLPREVREKLTHAPSIFEALKHA